MVMMMKNNPDEIVESIRQENKNFFSTLSTEMVKTANDNLKQLSSTLIGVATFLFTVSSPFVLKLFDTSLAITGNIKILIATSWLFLFVSIVLGVFHLFSEYYYFGKEAQILSRRAGLFATIGLSIEALQEVTDKSELLRDDSKNKSSDWFIIIQSLFVLIGFLFILVAAFIILF